MTDTLKLNQEMPIVANQCRLLMEDVQQLEHLSQSLNRRVSRIQQIDAKPEPQEPQAPSADTITDSLEHLHREMCKHIGRMKENMDRLERLVG
jgi:hypothetical protein